MMMSHGSLNVPIEHHPTIRYMVYNGYYKVMSNIPKMGQLPTPGEYPNKIQAGILRMFNKLFTHIHQTAEAARDKLSGLCILELRKG